MSRCVLDNEDRVIEVVIGWDPGMETFCSTGPLSSEHARSARRRRRSNKPAWSYGPEGSTAPMRIPIS